MKKIRAKLVVDLKVADDFNLKRELAVCQYQENGLNEAFLPFSEDFEVVDYLNIEEVE